MESLHHITLSLQTFSIIFFIIIPTMENKKKFTPNPDLKLLDQDRETLRYYHYSRSTEKTYCQKKQQ